MRSKLVWKLTAVVVAILAAAIALSGYAHNLICAHYTLESARASLRFNSESIVKGIGQQMMSHNTQGAKELIAEISCDSTIYGDIRLVSHRPEQYGRVVASRFGRDDQHPETYQLELEDPACAICHDQGNPESLEVQTVDSVTNLPDGSRMLSVMAPIINEAGCRNAACHAHADDSHVLGFLNADYSLQQVDAMAAERKWLVTGTVFASLLLGVVALWLMFTRLLERPIARLLAGTKRIAARDLDFRFDQTRSDEFGILEESFNTMTARIKTHQDEMRSAMEYLEGMVENSTDIIITANTEGLIETCNRGGEEALGYQRNEVIGRPIESLYVDPRERHFIADRLMKTGNVKNYETRLLTKDGQVRNVLLTLSPLRDREGHVIGTIGISKDVTEEKRLQRELIQSQKFAAIGQAVTGIQHAIKNLLNALKGGAYLVRNGMANDNRQRIEDGWAMVNEGIERISDLSHHMLNYAKEWKLELQRVDLHGLLNEICELNRQMAADKGVSLHAEPSGGLPAVLCDPKLIHMATTDILVNAIDACTWKDYHDGETPEIILKSSSSQEGGFVEIQVRDNGCGMNEEIQRNIFTPFFSTKKIRGSGLGLALTARIIKVHGGYISVDSEPDVGTTFHIHLPENGPKDNSEAFDGQTGLTDR